MMGMNGPARMRKTKMVMIQAISLINGVDSEILIGYMLEINSREK